jgi:ferric-dicitrate binding protein FerR (iron transport regulator)
LVLPHKVDKVKALYSIRRKAGFNTNKKRWITFAVQAAAVLVLSLVFSGIYNSINQGSEAISAENMVFQEIKASFGTQAKVELADGTIVFLNSGSRLRFPQSFDHQKRRLVILDGEGYFNVAKDASIPFVVQTSELDVKVTGTTFNINAYNDNPYVDIALVEGSVVLMDKNLDLNKKLMDLSPNQVATLNCSSRELSKQAVNDLYKYTAWINGRIVFYGDPIQTVVKKLEKWYNVEIVIADKSLENYEFTGTFIDESLEQILSILSRTSPMTFEMQPIKKQIDNSMSKRKIILRNKSLS